METQTEIEQLQKAIEALEGQRGLLGDPAVELALAPLRARLAALQVSHGEQRKLVTVLFADLADHTTLFDELDPEDVREITHAYFNAWKASITERGGVVEKFIGDAVLAVFGLPAGQEDDPERAIWAALEMAQKLQALNPAFEAQVGRRLAMRVGIHTGEVVVSTRGERQGEDFVLVGETVNLASRLQNAAPADGILITQDTYRHVRGIFRVSELEPLRLKGISEAVRAYQVTGARPRAFRLLTRGVEGVETPMIGREADFNRLQQTFWEAVEERECRVMTVIGEAGIGKSRLIYEFDQWLEALPERVYYFKGRAYPATRNLPYSLARSMLAFRFDIHDSDAPEVVWDKLEQGIRLVLGETEIGSRKAYVIGRLLGFALGPAPFRPEQMEDARRFQDQALVYLGEYFRTLAQEYPVAVLLEDIHWADNSSLDLIHRLDGAVGRQPVLIVSTTRPELFERRPNLGEGLPFYARIVLQPLTRRESRLLIEKILPGSGGLPEDLRKNLIERAEGSPFYIEEGIKMLIEDGVLVRSGAGWRVAEACLDNIKIPPTLLGVLQARLDALDLQERLLLQRAAVIGRVFWDGTVAYLGAQEEGAKAAGHSGEQGLNPQGLNLEGENRQGEEVRGLLEQLRGRELVYRRERSSFADTLEYQFKHAVLRDVTYESLLKRQRRTYHAAAARWLEQAAHRSQRPDEYAPLIAEHYEQSGERAQAASWYLRAGRHAADRYANDEAVHAFTQAMRLTPAEDSAARFDMLLDREKVYDRIGERAAQAEDVQALSGLADRLGRDDARAAARLRQANYAFSIGDYSTAAGAAQAAIDLARRSGSARAEAEGYHLWGRALDYQEAGPQVLEKMEQALALARSAGLSGLEADVLLSLGSHVTDQGRFEQGKDYLRAALEIYRREGSRYGEGRVLANLGVTAWGEGSYEEARTYFEAALRMMEQAGDRRVMGLLVGNLGVIAMELADYGEALRYHHQALEIDREAVNRYAECATLGNLGEVYHSLGDFERARPYYDESAALARALGLVQNESAILFTVSRLHEHLGEYRTALEAAQRGMELARQSDHAVYLAGGWLRLGQCQLGLGLLDEAEDSFKQAAAHQRALGQQGREMEALAGLARVHQARGGTPAALQAVDAVLAHLSGGSLSGAEDPIQVYLTCCQVLQSAADPRLPDVLAAACRFLQQVEATIPQEGLKQSFKERIPANRALYQMCAGAG